MCIHIIWQRAEEHLRDAHPQFEIYHKIHEFTIKSKKNYILAARLGASAGCSSSGCRRSR